ncbi:MAG: DNA polymerase III subunit gamma/tau [Anaerolineae bacterium]
MAALTLYRKWRPQTFDEVIGQEPITQTLRNALNQGRLAHAYLFCGPRGTGKTSTARILAKAVNCLASEGEKPCNDCHICQSISEGHCLDLIEIDAASNRGIDEIRELRERVHFAPNEVEYKFYIVDEVHMLTEYAFNALLKTLEEPPAHAVFVLATTEPHKIPLTILSRCQRFDFRPISRKEIVAHLQKIAAAEGLSLEGPAVELIARHATGSLRDGISLLDQLMAYGEGHITLSQVQNILGTVSSQAVGQLVGYVIAGDVAEGLRLINQVIGDGADPRQFNHELLEYLRGLLLIRGGAERDLLNVTPEVQTEMVAQAKEISTERLVGVIKIFNQAAYDLKTSSQPYLPLEVSFVEATLGEEEVVPIAATAERGMVSPSAVKPTAEAGKVAAEVASGKALREEPMVSQAPPAVKEKPVTETVPPPQSGTEQEEVLGVLREGWQDFLATVKSHNRSVEALLKSCEPLSVQGDRVVLGFYYQFHKGKIEEPQCKVLVEKVLSQMLGQSYQVECVLTPNPQRGKKEGTRKDKFQAAAEDPLVKAAVKMYGAHIADVQ